MRLYSREICKLTANAFIDVRKIWEFCEQYVALPRVIPYFSDALLYWGLGQKDQINVFSKTYLMRRMCVHFNVFFKILNDVYQSGNNNSG